MENFFILNFGRRGRALVAPALAVMALAIILLAVGSDLPTASASTLPPERPENVTAAFTSYLFLPILFNMPAPAINWVDEFKSSKTGWIAGGDGCTGSYDTDKGRYKVTISSGHSGKSCIIYNMNPSNSPLYPFPRQFEGTFKVRVRRTTSDSYPLLVGFQFDTAIDSSDTSGTRWALESWPQTKDTGCNDGEGFYWLTAQQYKSSTSHSDRYYSVNSKGDNPKGDDVDGCTDAIDLDQYDWNEMAAVRRGSTVSVYLRNFKNDDGTEVDNTKSHEFKDVPDITPKDPSEPLGWTQMRLVSYSSSAVSVEFDRIEIRSSTAAPW
jgi:hypothetical protein